MRKPHPTPRTPFKVNASTSTGKAAEYGFLHSHPNPDT